MITALRRFFHMPPGEPPALAVAITEVVTMPKIQPIEITNRVSGPELLLSVDAAAVAEQARAAGEPVTVLGLEGSWSVERISRSGIVACVTLSPSSASVEPAPSAPVPETDEGEPAVDATEDSEDEA